MKRIHVDMDILNSIISTEGDSTIQNDIPTVVNKDDYASIVDKTAELYEVGNPDSPNHGSQDGPADQIPDEIREGLSDINPEVRPMNTAFQAQGNPGSLDQQEDPVFSEKGTEVDDYIKEQTDINEASVIDDHAYDPDDLNDKMEADQKTDDELTLTSEPTEVVENPEEMVTDLQVPGSGIDSVMADLEECLAKHDDIADSDDTAEDVVYEAEEADIPELDEEDSADEEYNEETEEDTDSSDVPAEVEETADTEKEEVEAEGDPAEEVDAEAKTEEAEEETGIDLDEDNEVGEDEDHAEAVEEAAEDNGEETTEETGTVESDVECINCDEENNIVTDLEISGIPETIELPEEVGLNPDVTTALDSDENVVGSNLADDNSMEAPEDVEENSTIEQGSIEETTYNVAADTDKVEDNELEEDAPASEETEAPADPVDPDLADDEEVNSESHSLAAAIRNFFKNHR